MWRGGVGLQVIGGCRLVYKEVVEIGSNYKNSYLWWFGSDLTWSNCLCVWRKSRELGGRRSPRFPAPMMEIFSTDLLPAIKNYWAQTHLDLLILLRLNPAARGEHLTACLLLFESMKSVFKMFLLMVFLRCGKLLLV